MATGQDGLTQSERRELESLASRRKTALGLAQWARIVLHAAEGAKNKDIGLRGGRCGWRGLYDEPRPDAPRQIDDDVAEVVRETLETTPRDARQGSLCSMAKAAGFARIDDSSDLEGLRFSAPSHRDVQAFADSLFVEKARDIVGLLLSLPNARSFCVLPRRARLRAGSIQAAASHAPGTNRAAHPRLYAMEPSCSRLRDRQGHRAVAIRVIADASS